MDGVVAGSRRGTELFLIDVQDNYVQDNDVQDSKVTKTGLRPGDPQRWELVALPYQDDSDHWRARRPRRRKPPLRLISE